MKNAKKITALMDKLLSDYKSAIQNLIGDSATSSIEESERKENLDEEIKNYREELKKLLK
jgi:macrodomain Ter protein organizer (MatP/YcbG family)